MLHYEPIVLGTTQEGDAAYVCTEEEEEEEEEDIGEGGEGRGSRVKESNAAKDRRGWDTTARELARWRRVRKWEKV